MDNIATGKFITKKRKEQNLTQEQLAERFGGHPSFYGWYYKMGNRKVHAGLFRH